MLNKSTLLGFLKDHKIVIPKIQRDYVQGLNNARNNAVREEFLKDIKQKFDKQTEMNLDFIYGTYNDGLFTPLDGQQRLTTLFLLHWFALKDYSELKNFSFEIRDYSKEFVFKLTETKLYLDEGKTISATIENQAWFLNYWKKDTTVASMLTMLDDIQKEFKNQSEALSQWLQEKVTFNILKLEDFKLGDELYIKMNARGKALSDYENFKSWLDEKIPTNYKEKWVENLDKNWTDLVWSYDDGDHNIDHEMMVLFRTFILFHLNQDSQNLNDLDKIYKLLHGQNENGTGEKSFISLAEYESFIGSSINSFVKNISCFLNKFIEKKNDLESLFKEVDLWDNFNNPFKALLSKNTLKNKVLFFAIYQYVLKDKFDPSNFKKYLRVIRNLVEYSTIGFDDLNKYLSSIIYLASFEDLLNAEIEASKITGFNNEQIKEEIKKIELVKKDIVKDESIIRAENNPFLKGQISFLINQDTINQDIFCDILQKIEIHFDIDGVREEFRKENVFLRNFISRINGWGQLWNFPFNNERDNWKKLFSNSIYKDVLCNLLNKKIEDDWINENSKFEDNIPDGNWVLNRKMTHEDLYKTNLLSHAKDCFLRWSNGQYYIAPFNSKASWNKIIIGNKRNQILSQLLKENIIKCEQKYPDVDFFWGWEISFIYKSDEFKWEDDKIYSKDKAVVLEIDTIQKLCK